MAKKVEISFSTESYEERIIVFIDLVGFKNFIASDPQIIGGCPLFLA